MSKELIVFVTVADGEEARRIAESVVGERLAACVNIIGPIESIYRWEGKVTTDKELLLIVKTTEERYAQLEERVKQLHSYTTPEVLAIKVELGSGDYLKWIRDSTTGGELQEF